MDNLVIDTKKGGIIIDKQALQNAANFTYQKLNAGNNTLPYWLETQSVGTSLLSTPYNDYVRFWLSDSIYTEMYVSCVIAGNKNINVASTSIPGRNSNVLQFVDKGGWDIVFNIKLVNDFGMNVNESTEHNYKVREVGKDNSLSNINKVVRIASNPLSVLDSQVINNQIDALPDTKLMNIMQFFDKFFDDTSYKNIKVESKYLNCNLDVNYIIPYSISTSQNTEWTNQYDITIQCYSDIDDENDSFYDEIMPK